jgi:hypothetical protein
MNKARMRGGRSMMALGKGICSVINIIHGLLMVDNAKVVDAREQGWQKLKTSHSRLTYTVTKSRGKF